MGICCRCNNDDDITEIKKKLSMLLTENIRMAIIIKENRDSINSIIESLKKENIIIESTNSE